jgi:UTP--glucose-1-phosphate uridylyltransferase
MADLLAGVKLDAALMARFSFDEAALRRDAAAIAAGTLGPKSAVIEDEITPVEDVVTIDPETMRMEREVGETALQCGRVAVVVLNGGMATRFGGVVKGAVPVFEDRSFLALKAEDSIRAGAAFGRGVPFILMNSFATEAATMQHLAERDFLGLAAEDLLSFSQTISLRLRPDGTVFVDDRGAPSYYAPGHGDFFPCLRKSGLLAHLRARGVQTIWFSNVDNLGATIDPTILGAHLAHGADISVEVTAKRRGPNGAWDKGGAPARVGGVPQIVEGFRLPPDLPPDYLPDFSTNTFLFSLEALDQELALPRHVVEKEVNGQTVLQLESIACEVSAIRGPTGAPLLSLGVLRVPRDGPRGRFFPVKEKADLEAMREVLRERLEQGWKARDALRIGSIPN